MSSRANEAAAWRHPARASLRLVFVAGALAALPQTAVLAQTAVEDSVQSRPRPEFQPIGLQLDDAMTGLGQLLVDRAPRLPDKTAETFGSFQLFPKAEVSLEHTDNLYRRETDTVTDQIVKIAPSLNLQSEWANHALNFSLGAVAAQHLQTTSENYVNYFASVGGRLDIVEDEYLAGNLRFAQEHEQRGSPDDLGQPEPTPYRSYVADLSHTRRGAAIFSRLGGTMTRLDYDDVGAINNDDRDRTEYEGRWRIGWEDIPGTIYFIEPSVNARIYDDEVDDSGLRRNSKGWQILAGVTWDVSGVTFAEFGAGYLQQAYDDSTLDTISGWSVNGKLVWNATDLVTLTLDAQRSIEETTQADAAGILVTKANFTADYEMLYNLIADAKLSLRNDEFQGNDRNDDIWGVSAGLRYLLNEHYYGSLRVSHDERSSSAAGSGYTDNRIILTIGAQL